MDLDENIRLLADVEGLDFVGVADLTPVRKEVVAQGGAHLGRYPRAVSIGKMPVHAIVDRLSHPMEARNAKLYRHYCYDRLNERLDQAAVSIGSMIESEGFSALPIPASCLLNTDRLSGEFSNKLAAHLAGLGWIGKSCLLITPEAGPRVRWATVLTDAPLEPTGQPMESGCGDCRICVEACPAGAFTGKPFSPEDSREALFDASACLRHLMAVKDQIGERVCAMCVKVCPYGLSGR
jgi:epoxyqueuosine reductase